MPIILHLDVEAMFLISLFIIVSGFFLAIFFSAKTNERRDKKKPKLKLNKKHDCLFECFKLPSGEGYGGRKATNKRYLCCDENLNLLRRKIGR